MADATPDSDSDHMDTLPRRTHMRTVVRVGALWLLSVGLLLLAGGAWLLLEWVFESGEPCLHTCWLRGVFGLVSLMMLAIGASHVVAFIGVWRERGWGHVLGVVLAVAGLLVCLWLVADLEWAKTSLEWWEVLFTTSYVLTALILVWRLPRRSAM